MVDVARTNNAATASTEQSFNEALANQSDTADAQWIDRTLRETLAFDDPAAN